VPFGALDAALAEADLVISATASIQPVLTRERLENAKPLVVLDLAVPRDVAPDAGDIDGVTVIDIDGLASSRQALPASAETTAVEQIVATEVEHFLAWLRGADIAPTVAALRTRADDVVAAELRKLNHRRPEFSAEQRADVSRTLHRVVQQLLHSPTVRVRQLAAEPGGDQYAAMLRELFDLDVPRTTTQADAVPEIGEQS
jgi:glutamyl-tRNA reductase